MGHHCGSLTGSHRWRDSAGGDSPAAPRPAGDQRHESNSELTGYRKTLPQVYSVLSINNSAGRSLASGQHQSQPDSRFWNKTRVTGPLLHSVLVLLSLSENAGK